MLLQGGFYSVAYENADKVEGIKKVALAGAVGS